MHHLNCQNCGLHGQPFVPSDVPKSVDPKKPTVWIVGEAPGAVEAEKGRPFVGRSGKLLRSVLSQEGFWRNFNVVITNACLCRPENNRTPRASEIDACSWHLEELYKRFPPKAILACGSVAAKALGIRCSVHRDRGRAFDTPYGTAVVTYHPAFILRSERGYQDFLARFKRDVRKLKTLALNGKSESGIPEILLPKSDAELDDVLNELFSKAQKEERYVAFDIETLPISWDFEETKFLASFGVDPYNPYSDVCTIGLSGAGITLSFPVFLKSTIERTLRIQEELYKARYGHVLSQEEYRKARLKPEFSKDALFPPVVLEMLRRELDKYADVSISEERAKEWLLKFAESPLLKVAHNAKFELKFFLHRLGAKVRGVKIDTMLLAYLLEEKMQGFYSLDALVAQYLPAFEGYKKAFLAEDLLRYNAMDAYVTLLLARSLVEELHARPKWEQQKLKRAAPFLIEEATPFLAEVELHGFYCDVEKLEEIDRLCAQLQERALQEVERVLGTREITKKNFKLRFYERYDHEPIYTEKGELSLSSSAIQEVYEKTKNPDLKRVAAYVITYRKAEKIRSAYVKAYKKLLNPWSGRIHPSFHLTGTATGRLSSSSPNFQQIPRSPVKVCPECMAVPVGDDPKCPVCGNADLKKLFHLKSVVAAPEGRKIVAADYSQMEVRILAEMANDSNLRRVIEEGIDLHSYMASKIYGLPYEEIRAKKDTDERIATMRQNAKSATFGVIYGQTPQGLAQSKGIPLEEAEHIINTFYKEFPSVRSWIGGVHEFVRAAKAFYTPVGRVRRFEELNSKAFRDAQNFPIQSYASDVTLAAAIRLNELLREVGGFVVGLVHDSIEAEVPADKVEEAACLFKKAMINYVTERFRLTVPLKIDLEVGDNWGETQPLDLPSEKC